MRTRWGSAPLPPATAQLVRIHGQHENGAHGHGSPEGLVAEDREAAEEDHRDADAYRGARYAGDSAHEAGAADDHGRDRLQVVVRVARDGRRSEYGQAHERGETGQGTAHRVDLDQMPVDVDAGPAGCLLV